MPVAKVCVGAEQKDQCAMSGSAVEPSPQHAADQMRAATERLREQAWMVAPLTTPDAPASADQAEPASSAEG